jgi:hypothetical protein
LQWPRAVISSVNSTALQLLQLFGDCGTRRCGDSDCLLTTNPLQFVACFDAQRKNRGFVSDAVGTSGSRKENVFIAEISSRSFALGGNVEFEKEDVSILRQIAVRSGTHGSIQSKLIVRAGKLKLKPT